MSEQSENQEMHRRYDASLNMLRRVRAFMERNAWQDGESESELYSDIVEMISNEDLEKELFQVEDVQANLAMFVKRMARVLQREGIQPKLAERAFDYLKRYGLSGSILRDKD